MMAASVYVLTLFVHDIIVFEKTLAYAEVVFFNTLLRLGSTFRHGLCAFGNFM